MYTIDRTRAQELGLNMQEVANNLNISLSSSEQVSPNFWTDPQTGIPYFMAVQTPEYRLTNKNQLDNTLLASSTDANGTPYPEPARQYRDGTARCRSVGLQPVQHSAGL